MKESESEVAQLCPALCDPMAYSLPGSSVHGIFQAIVLECIAISFSRGSSQPRDWSRVSGIVDRRFTVWATSKVLKQSQMITKISRTKHYPFFVIDLFWNYYVDFIYLLFSIILFLRQLHFYWQFGGFTWYNHWIQAQ